MSKTIRMYNFILESENEFTKIFKDNDIAIYLSKAYDEDSNKHYVVASVPSISEIDASDIKYPFPFDVEQERNDFFDRFGIKNASEFTNDLVNFIVEQREIQNENKN